ncbi:MAG: hypothetical protein EHM66_00340 [Deltaproteobacteria bacterium]|nr:MAG: hypothetical protein EHM66_00340 [Deltaproteobacteria bacterium]
MALTSDPLAVPKKRYVAPQPVITNIPIPGQQQQQAAQPVRQVTTDPLQQQITPLTAYPVQQPPPTPDPLRQQPSLFGNTAPGIGQAYTNTLQDSLTGKIYDPFAAGQKEALARAEANKRAATANQIAGAGFSGTGIGQQIAGSTENQLLQNRFSTLNDLEQNRNATRQSALSEARAYGTAEEGIRQYEKDFGEGQRQFDVGQSNWQKNFDQMQKEYGDTQSWKAYEQALATGSDADVIARYKDATGKDLDPMAVEQYRGYYRRSQEQGLAAGDVAIKTAQSTLDTMKRTDAGTALSSYLSTHLDANASDPAMAPMLQKYWESLGNTGEVPKEWADQQVKAARDVRLNTEIGAFNYQIDSLVSSGQMRQEDAALLKDFNTGGLTQYLTRDPATGKVTFDYAKLEADTGSSSGTSTVKVPEGKEQDDIFEEGDKVYRVDADGKAVAVNSKDLTWDDLKGQNLGSDSKAYSAVLENTEKLDLQYKNDALTDSWKSAPEVGQVVKTTIGGKEVLLKTTFKGNQDVKLGFDNAYIEFEDMDGKKYYAGGKMRDSKIREGTGRESSLTSGEYLGLTPDTARKMLSSVNPASSVIGIAGNLAKKFGFNW